MSNICPYEESVQNIQDNECIGNSLSKINKNFSNLKSNVCTNFFTIDSLQSWIQNLDTRIRDLSGITVPGVAKAWLKFNGTRDTLNTPSLENTQRFIYSSYNVGFVRRLGLGNYRIFFPLDKPMPNSRYVVVGTSSQRQAATGLFTWFQPYRYTTTFFDAQITSVNATSVVDAEHISVVVY